MIFNLGFAVLMLSDYRLTFQQWNISLVQPSLQELQSHLFFPSSHWPAVVVQELSRNSCWIVDTAGSITNGTRKQNVAALQVMRAHGGSNFV